MSKRMKDTGNNGKVKIIIGVIIAILIVAIAVCIIRIAPDYMKSKTEEKMNLVINNNNVTAKMKNDIYENDEGVIFVSFDDVKNYFDKYIDYDSDSKRLTTTYDDKIATMIVGKNEMTVNGERIKLSSSAVTKDGKMYLPFSEMSEQVYNAKLEYREDTNIVVVDSEEKEVKQATVGKKTKLKYKAKILSRTLEKLEANQNVYYIAETENWIKVRIENGKIGYVNKKDINNIHITREAKKDPTQLEGKVNLFWDYFSKDGNPPNRSGETYEGINVVAPTFFTLVKDGDGSVRENVGEAGKEYIDWAKDNGYRVWATVSNTDEKGMMDTTSKIMNDYELREVLIDNIVNLVKKYEIDGINIDFENMKKEDIDLFSRFIIELTPKLKHLGKTVSVDVTAPDGSETWSLCFDRNVIGHVANYIVFMAYDQYGNGTKAGTTAGYNWVETNVKKFLNQEEVDKEKIILGIPLYTRLWKEEDGKTTSKTVNIKDVDSVLPNNVDKKWDEDLKQYYVEYKKSNVTYKMWIEDEESIASKIQLANQYQLGGIAFWEKDREPDGFWEKVAEELNKE